MLKIVDQASVHALAAISLLCLPAVGTYLMRDPHTLAEVIDTALGEGYRLIGVCVYVHVCVCAFVCVLCVYTTYTIIYTLVRIHVSMEIRASAKAAGG